LRPTIETLLKRRTAEAILNTILLPAMAEVGERMSRGEMILPFVLQAAEVMREAVTILEPHLAGNAGKRRGTIVLATVFGDVHDIGKNLIGSILRNQGFEVIDLGKQVPLEAIVQAVIERKPDAVGLSALLVTTSREMGLCVRELHRRGLSVPVLIGGAAVNASFAERIALVEDGTRYAGGVYFGKDAFDAAAILDRLREGNSREERSAAVLRDDPPQAVGGDGNGADKLDYSVVMPMFYGTSEVLRWEGAALLDEIDADRLFKGHWRGGNLGEAEFVRARRDEFMPALERLRAEILADKLLDARGLYGFFPAISERSEVVVLDPGDYHTELAVFAFPRMERSGGRSIADYFRPEGDVFAVQIVTLGPGLGARCEKYFTKDDRYASGFFLNGLGNYLTEHLADRLTQEIRRSLDVPYAQGKRYSFGYPGLPGLEQQAKLLEILGVEERLGVSLTPGFQMVPEHSTMGIFVHHPKAVYLS
jgi:5-methyltetrahydrofolate--homocysteine methyltransferase